MARQGRRLGRRAGRRLPRAALTAAPEPVRWGILSTARINDAILGGARELRDFARAIRGGGPPRLGRADAVAQARAIEALYRSAAEGRAVTP